MGLGKLHIAPAFGTNAEHLIAAAFGALVEIGAEEAQSLLAAVPPRVEVSNHASQRKPGV